MLEARGRAVPSNLNYDYAYGVAELDYLLETADDSLLYPLGDDGQPNLRHANLSRFLHPEVIPQTQLKNFKNILFTDVLQHILKYKDNLRDMNRGLALAYIITDGKGYFFTSVFTIEQLNAGLILRAIQERGLDNIDEILADGHIQNLLLTEVRKSTESKHYSPTPAGVHVVGDYQGDFLQSYLDLSTLDQIYDHAQPTPFQHLGIVALANAVADLNYACPFQRVQNDGEKIPEDEADRDFDECMREQRQKYFQLLDDNLKRNQIPRGIPDYTPPTETEEDEEDTTPGAKVTEKPGEDNTFWLRQYARDHGFRFYTQEEGKKWQVCHSDDKPIFTVVKEGKGYTFKLPQPYTTDDIRTMLQAIKDQYGDNVEISITGNRSQYLEIEKIAKEMNFTITSKPPKREFEKQRGKSHDDDDEEQEQDDKKTDDKDKSKGDTKKDKSKGDTKKEGKDTGTSKAPK